MILIQLTGLSGAGKTTLAYGVRRRLEAQNINVHVVDGDEYRQTLCRDLGFSRADRQENIRRLGAAAHDLLQPGEAAIISAINPYEETRLGLEEKYGAHTVWVHCPLTVLQERDTKGLYQRAALPEGDPQRVHNLTGVNDTYEAPAQPALVIDTSKMSVEEATGLMCRFILDRLER